MTKEFELKCILIVPIDFFFRHPLKFIKIHRAANFFHFFILLMVQIKNTEPSIFKCTSIVDSPIDFFFRRTEKFIKINNAGTFFSRFFSH